MSEASNRVKRKRRAIENQFVLATDQIGIDDRHPGPGDALAQNFVTTGQLVHVEGRGIEGQQQLRTRRAGRFGGARLPDVLADCQANTDARHLDQPRGISRCRNSVPRRTPREFGRRCLR